MHRSIEMSTRDVALPVPRRRHRVGVRSLLLGRPLFVVAAIVLAAAGFAGYYAVRATSWAVMTDELQIARLATSIAETLSPIPQIHGAYYGALSQLYPLLLAPFFGLLSAPAAVNAGHVFNALLLPSAAWPAFLLARSVTGSRVAGYAAAALTVFTPWLVLTSTLLTENAAYPAFVWAVYLCHRTVSRPSPANDALALGGLLVAFLARTQLLVVAVALPVVLLCHEAGFARLRRESLVTALRRLVSSHLVLVIAYGVAVAVAGALAAVGSLGTAVGNYEVSVGGDILPDGIWKAAAAHLAQVVVGAGVLPFLLALAWALLALVRPERKEAHAFAVLFVLLVPLLTLEVSSFDLRFTPNDFTQDRYLFYLVPLFAAGAGAMLVQRSHVASRVALLAAVTALFAWLVGFGSYDAAALFWASPAGAFHPAINVAADWLSLSAADLIRIAAGTVAVLAIVLIMLAGRAAVAVAIAVTAFGAFEAGYVFQRWSDPTMTRETTLAGVPRDWIDRAVPDNSSVALVPSAYTRGDDWWDVEYWNKRVDRLLRVDQGDTFSPFPANQVRVDFRRGTLRGTLRSQFLVLSPRESRFHPLARTVVDAKVLELVRARPPYRLEWATRGLTADGWKLSGRPVTLRLYGHGSGGGRTVVLTLSSSSHAAIPLKFRLRSGATELRLSVDPGGARPPVRMKLCVPARGYTDLKLFATGAVRIPDGRLVSVHVERIKVRPDGRPCRGSGL